MKRCISLILVILCGFVLSPCCQEDILHLGINATIEAIDAGEQVLYVADYGDENILGVKCAIDCKKLTEEQKILYVAFETEEIMTIAFSDLTVGDQITINAYESQLKAIADGVIEVEQIQLATQRLEIKEG